MELSVRVLVRLLDSLDILDDIESFDKIDVDTRCVTDESEHGVVLAEAAVNRDAEAFKPVYKIVALLFVVIFPIGIRAVWFATGLTWVITALAGIIRYRQGKWLKYHLN